MPEAPRITPEHLESLIVDEHYHVQPDTTLTICVLTVRNGFTVTGESACAAPENFDPELGRRIARQNAVNKLWPLEGYLLREMLDGPPCVVTDTLVARIAHEVNRAYCQHIGESQPSWANAPEWMVESALAGVRAHLDTARSPEESHALWMDHKLREGWKWGPVKDPAAKEHPCLVPYDHLPPEQRVKDLLFAAVCRAINEHAGDGFMLIRRSDPANEPA